MKTILLLIALFFTSQAFAVCTSVIARTNFSANQVLTSTRLNTELNTVYTRANELPGDCVTAATIDSTKLSTDLNPVLKGIKEGCLVTRSTAAIITVDKCLLAVNGKMVSTTSANTVTMACGACSAETVSTTYYVYAVTGSTGTTLTLKISTVAPNADGYNAGGDRVLARFYNNAASDIDQYSVDQWIVNKFHPQQTDWIAYTPTGTWDTNVTYAGTWRRVGSRLEGQASVLLSGAPNATYLCLSAPDFGIDSTRQPTTYNAANGSFVQIVDTAGPTQYHGNIESVGGSGICLSVINSAGTYSTSVQVTNTVPFAFGSPDYVNVHFFATVSGWND
jgi:hypothetical protein